MPRSVLAVLLALSIASASPLNSLSNRAVSNLVNSVECLAVNDVVTALKASSATPFCSSYLSIGTSTVWTTTTNTPPSLTATSTSLTTAPAATATTTVPTSTSLTITQTATTTPTTVTTSTTTSYSTYSCISGATTLTSSVITGTPAAQKRAVSTSSKQSSSSVAVPTYLSKWASAQITTACECLSLTSATVTSTSTTTLAPGTVTTVVTSIISPTTTVTVFSTSTSYTTTTTTATADTVTSTATNTLVLPTPSGLGTGFNYYAYQHNLNYDNPNPGFDATAFDNPNYQSSGFATDVNSFKTFNYPQPGSACQLPGQSVQSNCGQIAIVMQGYFYAAYGAGPYTLSTPNTIDNGLYFWDYANAFDYNNNNVAYQAVRAGSSGFYGGSTTLTLAYGELVPVTIIWINGGGNGAAFMKVTGPDGIAHSSTAGFFIPADDSGSCPNLVDPFSP